MGYLLLSVYYPTDQQRDAYLQSIPSNFRSATFGIYQPLPASADQDEWNDVWTILRASMVSSSSSFSSSSSSLLDQPTVRPLKPNDDNYQAFVGPQWKRFSRQTTTTTTTGGGVVSPQLAAFFNKALRGNDPTPHYDHCANCTQKQSKESKQCSRCKIVQYCSRECQAQHWKSCHKGSCVAAQSNRTVWEALQTNDGFRLTEEECLELSRVLEMCTIGRSSLTTAQPTTTETGTRNVYLLIQGFATYFKFVSELGGCFVL